MTIQDQKWTIKSFIRGFFPLQLLVAHLKHNLFALMFWLILFLIANDSLGYAFGIPLLFLSPEYAGNVSPVSFFFLGFSFGGFIMAFNTYSYIKLGPRFPFMTTLAQPFFKFCLNNGIIPAAFILFFMIKSSIFQAYEEFASGYDILKYNFALITGVLAFFILSFFYFFPLARRRERTKGAQKTEPIVSIMHREEEWFDQYVKEKDRTYIYFGKRFRIKRSRSIAHLKRSAIQGIFAKNRINASVFEIMTISAFFLIGLFNSYDFMEMPAAMSLVLLMTIILMLFSALKSWFRHWAYPILILVIIGMDFISSKVDAFNYKNYAYGLSYEDKDLSEYSYEHLERISSNDSLTDSSYDSYIETLENWKAQTGEKRPKLVIVNSSGGGSRSALWTLTVLQQCDKQLDGKLNKHIQMMTGASGGMVGAAYFRELLLRHSKGEMKSLYSDEHCDNISKDLLNKLAFTATTSDIFIRFQTCEYNGRTYPSDRGYAFEQQLHKNTGGLMDHTLEYYAKYEKNGTVPTLIFSPTVINDGRRMLISSQHLNFLTGNHGGPASMTRSNENIDYLSFFDHQDAGKIRYSTVLRSSASFPYVMPMVNLPTKPQIQLMDAGIRDNFGTKTLIEFLHVMRDWIKENTSGVVILQIRDTKKMLGDQSFSEPSFLDRLTLPMGNVYKNLIRVQDFNEEELMKIGIQPMQFPVDLISFNLREYWDDRISLSWHLTKQEKVKIREAFHSDANKHSFQQLRRIL